MNSGLASDGVELRIFTVIVARFQGVHWPVGGANPRRGPRQFQMMARADIQVPVAPERL